MARGQESGTTILLGIKAYKVGEVVGGKERVVVKTSAKGKEKRCPYCGSERLYGHGSCKPREVLHHVSKPTIAQVQGHCIAARLMLAAMCDIIVASEDASFSNPVVRMAGNAVEVLIEPWELGVRKAKEFLFLGDRMDAQEA